MSKKNRIRIFVDEPLAENARVVCLDKMRHYLVNVMRQGEGDRIFVFNGRDGEFAAKIAAVSKKDCELKIESRFAVFSKSPDVWLLFAPLKKDNTDLVVTKSVELGVSKIIPIHTEWTVNAVNRPDRLHALAIEASEQSRRQDIPVIEPEKALETMLKNWPEDRKLIFLDESGASGSFAGQVLNCSAPAALLIGPEAGFSKKELEILRALPYAYGVSLGKRILRAETAALAALACWQAFCGDWK